MEFIRWRNIFLMKNLLLQLTFNYIFTFAHFIHNKSFIAFTVYMYTECSMLFFVGAYIRADIL